LKTQLANKKDAQARERAVDAIKYIASHANVSPAVEPYLIAMLPNVLAACGDKQAVVQKAAGAAALAIAKCINPNGVKAALPHIISSLRNASKWQEKMVDLQIIEALCKTAPVQTGYRVPDLLPVVSDTMWYV
jgi:elongation factor 3